MARPSIQAEVDQWRRLADHLKQRLKELRWTQEDAITEASRRHGPSRSVWLIAFTAGQKNGTMDPTSLSGIEDTLGWGEGSCERILLGGRPNVTRTPANRSPRHEEEALHTMIRQMRSEMKEVRERLDAIEANSGRTGQGGGGGRT